MPSAQDVKRLLQLTTIYSIKCAEPLVQQVGMLMISIINVFSVMQTVKIVKDWRQHALLVNPLTDLIPECVSNVLLIVITVTACR